MTFKGRLRILPCVSPFAFKLSWVFQTKILSLRILQRWQKSTESNNPPSLSGEKNEIYCKNRCRWKRKRKDSEPRALIKTPAFWSVCVLKMEFSSNCLPPIELHSHPGYQATQVIVVEKGKSKCKIQSMNPCACSNGEAAKKIVRRKIIWVKFVAEAQKTCIELREMPKEELINVRKTDSPSLRSISRRGRMRVAGRSEERSHREILPAAVFPIPLWSACLRQPWNYLVRCRG